MEYNGNIYSHHVLETIYEYTTFFALNPLANYFTKTPILIHFVVPITIQI